MQTKGAYLILGSVLLFIINFLTLLNLNFTKNQGLQSLGAIIALFSMLLLLLGVVLTIKNILRGKTQTKSQPIIKQEKQLRTHPKRLIGVFIFLWLFIVFPLIAMWQMGLIHKLFGEIPETGGNTGAIIGMVIFIPLAMVGTIYPGLYLSPLIVFPILLLPLATYFIFSHTWHKTTDTLLLIFVVFCLVVQMFFPQLVGMTK